MRTTRLTVLLTFVALAACQKPETPAQTRARMGAESDSARTAIAAVDAAFAQHFSAGHADSVAALYVADAVLMPPNSRASVGRDSIRATIAGYFTMLPGVTLTLRAEHVRANGPMAIERGRYVLTPAGAPADSGKYIVQWTRVDGPWRIVADIWNSDLPPAPAPAPRRH